MRVTNEIVQNNMLFYLTSTRSDVYKQQELIASGKRVQVPSDDPTSYSIISRLIDSQSTTEQYLSNASRLSSDLKIIDDKLTKVTDILNRMSELTTTASDNTNYLSYPSFAEEVNEMLEEMLVIANTQSQGNYIFAGLRSTVSPYVATRDAEGKITGITYRGSSSTHQVEVGQDVYVVGNTIGTDLTGPQGVFQSSQIDIFNDLIHLRDRLLAGENLVSEEEFTADPLSDQLTVSRNYVTGQTVMLSTKGTLPSSLNDYTYYYVIRDDDTHIRLATSLENARAGVAIDLTDAGTGSQGITQTTLNDITADANHILTTSSRIGAYEERVDFNTKFLNDYLVQIAAQLEPEQSVDIAEAITELSAKKTAYEGAIRATVIMSGSSLLDYI
jgi:flagellar hook-associated protein 3 FlgL